MAFLGSMVSSFDVMHVSDAKKPAGDDDVPRPPPGRSTPPPGAPPPPAQPKRAGSWLDGLMNRRPSSLLPEAAETTSPRQAGTLSVSKEEDEEEQGTTELPPEVSKLKAEIKRLKTELQAQRAELEAERASRAKAEQLLEEIGALAASGTRK